MPYFLLLITSQEHNFKWLAKRCCVFLCLRKDSNSARVKERRQWLPQWLSLAMQGGKKTFPPGKKVQIQQRWALTWCTVCPCWCWAGTFVQSYTGWAPPRSAIPAKCSPGSLLNWQTEQAAEKKQKKNTKNTTYKDNFSPLS